MTDRHNNFDLLRLIAALQVVFVMNAFLQRGWTGHPQHLGGAVVVTLGLALASWHLVERPALRLKRRPTSSSCISSQPRLQLSVR